MKKNIYRYLSFIQLWLFTVVPLLLVFLERSMYRSSNFILLPLNEDVYGFIASPTDPDIATIQNTAVFLTALTLLSYA